MKYLLKLFSTFLFFIFLNIQQSIVAQTVPQSEKDALIALYNSADGPNWTDNTNWNTNEPVSTWAGVTVVDGHVTSINRFQSNLTGTLPVELQDLTSLEYLQLVRNNLSGTVPDLTGLANLNFFNINLNNFQFADFENEFASYSTNIADFYYAVMNKVELESDVDLEVGQTYVMNMPVINGTGVTYQWYKNNEPIINETGLTYTIANAQVGDAGNYTCKASSSIITDLVIERETVHIYRDILVSDRDALVALYNSTNGANWTTNANWNTAAPVYQWHGITVSDDRVIEINLESNNLVGGLPTELGDLDNLEKLVLNFNNLTGNIPSQLGNCTSLTELNLWSNNLSGTIPSELGNCTSLITLSFEDNQLTGNIPTSFANITTMFSFWVNGNQLSGEMPDITSNWPDLYYFSIGDANGTGSYNNFTGTLDLSNNPALRGCWVDNTNISALNIKNGNNEIINGNQLITSNTPNLTCIQVDDAAYSFTNWSQVDPTASFSTDCSNTTTIAIPDANFEQALIDLGFDTNGLNGNILETNALAVTELYIDDPVNNVNLPNVNAAISDLTGLQGFTNLSIIHCRFNQLLELDVTNNAALTELECESNQLTELDVTQNPLLHTLGFGPNNISTIDLSQNLALEKFWSNGNNLSTLNLDANSNLNVCGLSDNSLLNYVSLQNGNNENMVYFIADNTPSLTCINADATVSQTMLNSGKAFSTDCSNTTTIAIPDANFEQALIDLGIDTNGLNGNILETNAEAVTGTLYVNSRSISDLTGIEAFTNITALQAGDNQLATIDVSNNLALTKIWTYDNNLTSLDLSNNTLMDRVSTPGNQLTSIDITNCPSVHTLLAANNQISTIDLSNNPLLNLVHLENNSLSSIDFSSNPVLTEIRLFDNQITALDISSNTLLTRLELQNNQLTSIDVTTNTELEILFLENNLLTSVNVSQNINLLNLAVGLNSITSLDVTSLESLTNLTTEVTLISELDLSNNVNLEQLWVADNPNLTHLDLSSNPLLWNLGIYNTPIESLDLSDKPITKLWAQDMSNLYRLDLSNGNNTNVTEIFLTNNPSLECVSVDDAVYATTNWLDIDPTASYSEDCNSIWTVYTTDENLDTAINAYLGVIDTDMDGVMSYEEAMNFTGTLDLSGSGIIDITGLEAFTSVTEINLSGNSVTDISSLIFGNVVTLTRNGSQFKTVERRAFNSLQILNCSNNNLKKLDVSIITTLTSLDCSNNQLEVLNVKNGNNINFVNFDASGNPGLYCVLVDDVSYSNTNWAAKDAQTLFSDTDCNAKLQPKVFIQGAMLNPISGEETLMRDNLRSLGYLPTISPYADALTCDVSVFNVTGNDAIVDWIEISLRDALSPEDVLETRSALLQRDGDVVDVDGVSEISFNLWAKSYYISFNHRNHLGIMTNASSVLNFTPSVFNFADGSELTYGTNAQTSSGMPSGIFGLWAGDTNSSGQVRFSGANNGSNTIKDFVLADSANGFNSVTFSSTGYLNTDLNMDGSGKFSGSGNDSNVIKDNVLSHPGNGFNSPTFTILSTVPNN